MDPRQFIKNSNIQIERPGTVSNTRQSISTPTFNELRIGKFRQGTSYIILQNIKI